MATPREITSEKYRELFDKCLDKAIKNAKACGRSNKLAYWFSVSFSPCGATIPQKTWKNGVKPHYINHYADQPCDEFCQDNLPMTTCLVMLYKYDAKIDSYRSKFYTCRHKVGNCPWKE